MIDQPDGAPAVRPADDDDEDDDVLDISMESRIGFVVASMLNACKAHGLYPFGSVVNLPARQAVDRQGVEDLRRALWREPEVRREMRKRIRRAVGEDA